MLKNISRLESVVGDKIGHFYCDNDTPLHVAKEMLFQFQKYIGQVEDNIKAQHDAKIKAEQEALPSQDDAVNVPQESIKE